MTKDEQIAMMQQTISTLREERASMVAALRTALDRIPPAIERSAGAERQQRYRDRRVGYGDRHRVPLLQMLIDRDGSGCRYCNSELTIETATIDHVLPVSRGGSDDPSNLTLACAPCNSGKQDRDGITEALLRDRQRYPKRDATPVVSTPSVGSSEDVPGSGEERTQGSTTDRGQTSPKRNGVTLDLGRAEADAASLNLTGAAFTAELQRFTDYWDSAGWKRKSGPVKDRNATWRTWLNSPFRSTNGTKGKHDNQQVIDEWSRQWSGEAEVVEVTG